MASAWRRATISSLYRQRWWCRRINGASSRAMRRLNRWRLAKRTRFLSNLLEHHQIRIVEQRVADGVFRRLAALIWKVHAQPIGHLAGAAGHAYPRPTFENRPIHVARCGLTIHA